MSRDPNITPCACSKTAAHDMDLQVKVHFNQSGKVIFLNIIFTPAYKRKSCLRAKTENSKTE